MQTTVGQILINESLPPDLRDYNRTLDKKGINDLLREVARRHPDQYRDVSHKLNQIGWLAAQESGGFSFGLQHLTKSKAAIKLRERLQREVAAALDDDKLTDKQRADLIIKTVGKEAESQQKDVFNEALAANNPLAFQTQSGSRGNKMNLASLLGSDLLYTDHHDQVIPIPVLRSYSEGLTPAEYWAGTYGARKGVMATKFATQEAGYLSKQLNQVAHRLIITDQDGDGEPDGIRGMPVDTDDEDNEGALLAVDTGPYKRNTVLTPKILRSIRRAGFEKIIVRSPIIGGSPEGGVYARDVGVREHGGLPGRGENVGLAAAQALSEPLSQAQLSAKHSGGVAGAEKSLSGFDYINQLIQVPKHFKGGAAHSEEDGIVSAVSPAPAGGYNVSINGKQHYVPEGMNVSVKRGDRVEAGDVLSEGIPNPAQVVRFKGIGEGRRYFVQAYKKALAEAGLRGHRRNIELLARGLINHVRMTEEMGDKVPDDVVPYSTIENMYQPRPGHRLAEPRSVIGKYLEKPVLHYTIGTKISPSVVKNMDAFGLKEIDVHDEPPPFEPDMIRGAASLQYDPDWLTRMYGSGQKSSLTKAVHRGAVSDEAGTSFVPALTRAVDFGRVGATTKPEPVTPVDLDNDDTMKEVTYKQGLFDDASNVPGAADSPSFEQEIGRQRSRVKSVLETARAQAKMPGGDVVPPPPSSGPGSSPLKPAPPGGQLGNLFHAFRTLTRNPEEDYFAGPLQSTSSSKPAKPSQPARPAQPQLPAENPDVPSPQATPGSAPKTVTPEVRQQRMAEATGLLNKFNINPHVTAMSAELQGLLSHVLEEYAAGTIAADQLEADLQAIADAARTAAVPG